MARREILIPIVAFGVPPTPFGPLAGIPGGIAPPGFLPGSPFGLPPLPPFFGQSIGGGVGGPIVPGNQGSGWINNQLGDLLGNITSPMIGGGGSGQGRINNIVIPPVTSIGVPFTVQFYFMNLTTAPITFAGILNVQGLGLDQTPLPGVLVLPGQAGSISQNMTIPVGPQTGAILAPSFPGTFQLVHTNANGASIVDDEQTFTIPGATSVAVGVMPVVVGSPDTTTPDTKMAVLDGAGMTLPSVPGAGIVPMMTMTTTDPVTGMTMTVPSTATSPMWNPNDPMHMRGDECSNLPMMLPDLPPPNPMMPQTMMDQMVRMEHMRRQREIRRRHHRCRRRKMGMMWQGGMLVDGKWVPGMMDMDKKTNAVTMVTDPDTGKTTTTTTSTMVGPSTVLMNPIVNNNMDLGDIRMQLAPEKMGALPINSPANQVQGSWMPPTPMVPIPPGPATLGTAGGVGMPGTAGGIGTSGLPGMIPQLPQAMNMPGWWNQNWMPMFNQSMWNQGFDQQFNNQPRVQQAYNEGVSYMDMQRTGSFQWMPWINPNNGQPGTLAVPMMQWQPQTFMVPGAMLATDLDSQPSISDMEESTPFNDELDVMMLGRNRDRERGIEVPMPTIYGCVDVVPCGDNDEWAVLRADSDGGSGLDIPNEISGYNFCPNEMVKIQWHMVLYGDYGVEGQIFRGNDSVMTDHSGRFNYHLRLNDLPDGVNAEGLVSAHGITSHKHANCTLGIT